MKARISDKNSQQGWVLVIGLVVLFGVIGGPIA